MEQALKERFKLDSFRGNQKEIITAVLENHDVLVILPTGAGKSLTYQLPAVIQPGITLVVSPLLALIQNQVNALRNLKIKAESLNSSIKQSERTRILADLESEEPTVKLLYVTPELLATENFRKILVKIHTKGLLMRLVIDEAHCISEWGNDFRRDYRKLVFFKRQFPTLPITALTATATPLVKNDIIEATGLDPKTLKIFTSSFKRDNLHYEVRFKKSEKEIMDDIVCFLQEVYANRKKRPEKSGSGEERIQNICGIIYCSTRQKCDNLSAKLRESGVLAKSYHAGLTANQRKDVLDLWSGVKRDPPRTQSQKSSSKTKELQFIKGQTKLSFAKSETKSIVQDKSDSSNSDGQKIVDIVVATLSFGMGIDKQNVRFVIHADIPKTLESYYQESGRAGRDGKVSRCILYYCDDERSRILFLLTSAARSSEGETRKLQDELAVKNFEKIVKYCTTTDECRHVILSKHFGEEIKSCEKRCDVCTDPNGVKKRYAELVNYMRYSSFENGKNTNEEDVKRLKDGSLVRMRNSEEEFGFQKASNLHHKRKYEQEEIEFGFKKASEVQSRQEKREFLFGKTGHSKKPTTNKVILDQGTFKHAFNPKASSDMIPLIDRRAAYDRIVEKVQKRDPGMDLSSVYAISHEIEEQCLVDSRGITALYKSLVSSSVSSALSPQI